MIRKHDDIGYQRIVCRDDARLYGTYDENENIEELRRRNEWCALR